MGGRGGRGRGRKRIEAITGLVGAPSMACDALSELMHCDRRHFLQASLSCCRLLLVDPKSVRKGNDPKERMGKCERRGRDLADANPITRTEGTGDIIVL